MAEPIPHTPHEDLIDGAGRTYARLTLRDLLRYALDRGADLDTPVLVPALRGNRTHQHDVNVQADPREIYLTGAD
ncbi:hypothetical protein [Deinococcus kurensis]|uniref:hypothetical protein n=1 Tax=Deinococcus kurensis TaxID=2662757 RepID=UPI0012D2E812|nr:hypothetical protein [Deinococcus kurensis]